MTPLFREDRRKILRAAAALPLAALGPAVHAAEQPLKLALLTSLSGVFQSLGESMRAGLELFLEQNDYQMGGRKVQLIVEDDHGKPDEALRKLHKLIARDKIDILCGVIASNIALALRDTLHEARLPSVMANASANALAREAASPYIFRVTKTNWMLGHTGALWAHEQIAQSGAVTLASDYAAGREYIGDFADTFQEQGGRISEQLWTPLGTSDFSPLISKLAAARPEFVYCFLPGADAVRFLQQMKDYGAQGRIPLLGPGALFDQEDVIPAAGDAALGGTNTFQQSPEAPAAAAFARDYSAKSGRLPGEASTSGYVSGQVIKAGIDAAQGDLARFDAFKDHLLGSVTETAFGPMAFDSRNNQAILDIYVNEVQKDDNGQPLNVVVHTYRDVQDPGPKNGA